MAGTTHRLKVEGTSYACSCGNWSVTGSKSRATGIRAAHSQHIAQAPAAPKGEPVALEPANVSE